MAKDNNFVEFTPGTIVLCPSHLNWGLGQIQSCIGNKVTINFEECGKKVIDLNHVELIKKENVNR